MKRRVILLSGAIACGALLSLATLLVLRSRTDSGMGDLERLLPAADVDSSAAGATRGERTPGASGSSGHPPSPPSSALPTAPTNPEELRQLAAWLKGLPKDELLLLSNAEFGFEKSPLIEMLRNLEGDWVVSELGTLAVGETDPLVKAVLVAGLCKESKLARKRDPRMIDQIRQLLPQMSDAASDPYRAAGYVVYGAFTSCLAQKADYAALVLPHLETSENPDVLSRGYLFLGQFPGTEDVLARAVAAHPDAQGRFGALEGLRAAGMGGRVPPEELTRVGLDALSKETSERNRMLLVELIGSTGGEAGLRELEGMVERGEPGLVGHAASMIAVKMEPGRAQETLVNALRNTSLSPEDRGNLYRALGAVPGEGSGAVLLEAVANRALPEGERLQALQGLWNRPGDERVRQHLADILESDEPGAMRAESLRMLALDGKGAPAQLDCRKLAEEDSDPALRKEAVMLSALRGGDDSRGWLEERLLNDRSPDVKAAALGALVMQAHYTGDGDAARNHLARVKKLTNDSQIQEMIEQGEQMISSYDPRRIDLELREQADLYREIAPFTSGAARHAMERNEAYYRQMVETLTALSPTKK